VSLFAGLGVLLLSLLLLHAIVAPGLHGLAHWLYRGTPPARADRRRTSAAFLLLAASPALVAVLGLSGLGHLAEEEGAWAGLLAACRRFHEHCDLLLASSAAELPVYGGLILLVASWLARAAWLAFAPVLAVRRLPSAPIDEGSAEKLRVAAALVEVAAPIRVVSGVRGVALTAGFAWPRILLSPDVVDALAPDHLAAVLAHESAHVRGRDALRDLVIRFASALSPTAGLSCRAERAYDLDREILCDHEAVARGADPLALAGALVRVARLRTRPLGMPAAAGIHDVERAVTTRVRILLAGAERGDAPDPTHRAAAVSAAVVLAALALPHAAFGLIVSVHCGVETLVHLLA